MLLYLLGGTAIVAALMGGGMWYQTERLERTQSEVVELRGQLTTCGGRLNAILRDVESDNEVDNLDLYDFDIPAEWLRGGQTPTSN